MQRKPSEDKYAAPRQSEESNEDTYVGSVASVTWKPSHDTALSQSGEWQWALPAHPHTGVSVSTNT